MIVCKCTWMIDECTMFQIVNIIVTWSYDSCTLLHNVETLQQSCNSVTLSLSHHCKIRKHCCSMLSHQCTSLHVIVHYRNIVAPLSFHWKLDLHIVTTSRNIVTHNNLVRYNVSISTDIIECCCNTLAHGCA